MSHTGPALYLGVDAMNKGFYDRQLRKLASPLDEQRVQRREQDGKTLHYIEGWYAIAEANAIFGFDGWDRETVHFERVFERSRAEGTSCAYVARVRVSVRARATRIVREGTGFGQASAPFAADAHERALKAAETDATKRALSTFGGRFGLMLYDKEHRAQSLAGASQVANGRANVERSEGKATAKPIKDWQEDGAHMSGAGACEDPRTADEPSAAGNAGSPTPLYRLTCNDGSTCEVKSAESFCSGLRQLIGAGTSIGEVEELRRMNEAIIDQLRALEGLRTPRGEHYVDILDRLFARRCGELASLPDKAASPEGNDNAAVKGLADEKASLPIGEQTGLGDVASTVDVASAGDEAHYVQTNIKSDGAKEVCAMETGSVVESASCDHGSSHSGAKPLLEAKGDDLGANGLGAPTSSSKELDMPSKITEARTANGASSTGPAQKLFYKPFVPAPPYPLSDIAAKLLGERAPVAIAQIDPSANDAAETPKEVPNAPPPRCAVQSLTRRSQISGGFSVDKSALAIPSERRLRSKAHLAMVASKPCLVCEGGPCHAHHVTFAQPRGLSLKVSDEYTVPLCGVHHNELHAVHNEASWWRSQGIEPLVHARALWLITAGLAPNTEESVAKTTEADSGSAAKSERSRLT